MRAKLISSHVFFSEEIVYLCNLKQSDGLSLAASFGMLKEESPGSTGHSTS